MISVYDYFFPAVPLPYLWSEEGKLLKALSLDDSDDDVEIKLIDEFDDDDDDDDVDSCEEFELDIDSDSDDNGFESVVFNNKFPMNSIMVQGLKLTLNEKKASEYKCAEEGKRFDVISMLSNYTNFLQRLDGRRVEIKSLEKKYILVCCVFVPSLWVDSILRTIAVASFELYNSRKDFEMVIVPQIRRESITIPTPIPQIKGEYMLDMEAIKQSFFKAFSPNCLQFPSWDTGVFNAVANAINFVGCPKFLLVDEDQIVMFNDELDYVLGLYGIDAFPFTNDKLSEDYEKADEIMSQACSVEEILGCDSSDVVCRKVRGSTGEEKLSIKHLKEKVLGLYLFKEWDLLRVVRKIEKACREANKEFEVVLICAPPADGCDPEVFRGLVMGALEKMNLSWWVAPVKTSANLRLAKTFNLRDGVIVMGPHSSYYEPRAGVIMERFGIDAYPFTKQCLIEKELEKLNSVTLESLLVYESRDYVLKGKTKLPVSDLKGKHTLLYFYSKGPYDKRVRKLLAQSYAKITQKYKNLEVVCVSLSRTKCTGMPSPILERPWLVCPYNPRHSAFVCNQLFVEGYLFSALVAFRGDGHVCSINVEHRLEHGADVFNGDLGEDVRAEFDDVFYRHI